MTKEEYKELYCNSSPSMMETFDKYFYLIPCDCGLKVCKGWEIKFKEDKNEN